MKRLVCRAVCILALTIAVTTLGSPDVALAQVVWEPDHGAIQAERDRQNEQLCMAGKPADDWKIELAIEKADLLLKRYFELSSRSKPGALGKVFALKVPGVSWKDANGTIPVEMLREQLDEPKFTLERLAFVVMGDARTARGLWRATSNESGQQARVYAIDFTLAPGVGVFYWRIWHVTILDGSEPPAAPIEACHYDPDKAW